LIRHFLQDYIVPKLGILASDHLQTIEGTNMWKKIYAQNPKKIWAYNGGEETTLRIRSHQQLQDIILKNDDEVVFLWKN